MIPSIPVSLHLRRKFSIPNLKIGFIYPSVSTESRTIRVRVEISNPSMRIRPGIYAEVDVSGGNETALTAPADAVINAGDTQYAFVVHDRIHFQPRLVKIGRQYDDWIEILSGLSEGYEVVTNANFLIDSESRLKEAITGLGGSQAGSHAGHSQ